MAYYGLHTRILLLSMLGLPQLDSAISTPADQERYVADSFVEQTVDLSVVGVFRLNEHEIWVLSL